MNKKIIFGLLIFLTFVIGGCTSSDNLNLPCGFNGAVCQMAPLGNYYNLDEAKNWDCEKMPGMFSMVFNGNSKNLCLALKYRDADYCKKLKDNFGGNSKITCEAIVTNNPELCKNIDYASFSQSKEIKELIQKNEQMEQEGRLVNITADELSERDMKSLFYGQVQSCYFQVGADNKNVEACNLINETETRDKKLCLSRTNISMTN